MSKPALPHHIAAIMDGNGRWAKARKRPRLFGHVKGAQAAERLITFCLNQGIPNLTLFAFGTENWRRPQTEVKSLFKLFRVQLNRIIKRLNKQGVRMRFIGDRTKFSAEFLQVMEAAENLTARNSTLVLNMAVSYSGQWDICQASQQLAAKVAANKLQASDINPTLFQSYLSTADCPPVDLLIRSSGEMRLSNFLLWQCAYAELYFSDKYWPDFDEAAFTQAITWFGQRERRFGQTSEQTQGK